MAKHSPLLQARAAGVLLHITSLPGPHGIGDLGPAARTFVETLHGARQTWWQILPLNPPGAGYAPYNCYSAFAGNPLLISLEDLAADGLVDLAALQPPAFDAARVDFPAVASFKKPLLKSAWERFRSGDARALRKEFAAFCSTEAHWLDDFALFMALHDKFGTQWQKWPQALVQRRPEALRAARRELADPIAQTLFEQFLFFRQLRALREHCHEKNVRLLSDVPIFVSPDSVDVWMHPHLFQLDAKGNPTAVAGVPPDIFCKAGQRWGNPLYNWKAMEREGFAWWIARFRAALQTADAVRLDHFRGFVGYWEIPARAKTAKNGHWRKAPGDALFEAVREAFGHLPFVAEDLGLITPDVEALRDKLHLPGMRVLQFAFEGDAGNPHLPFHYPEATAAYPGTHDNNTTAGWYAKLPAETRDKLLRLAPEAERNPAHTLIRMAWISKAKLAITPLQDLFQLDENARMNVPGTPNGNWAWRWVPGEQDAGNFDWLRELTSLCDRVPPVEQAAGSSAEKGRKRSGQKASPK